MFDLNDVVESQAFEHPDYFYAPWRWEEQVVEPQLKRRGFHVLEWVDKEVSNRTLLARRAVRVTVGNGKVLEFVYS
jgi:hypothetical protein